jgi:transcription elongation factor GreB
MEQVKNLLTKEGYLYLRNELGDLLRTERPKVVIAVTEAAAHGDRSENAEYIYGKKRLREIDKRIQYLSSLLKKSRVIDTDKILLDKVRFGCMVTVIDEDNIKKQWQIVGEGETFLGENRISYLAPIAKSLLGKKIGEIVEINIPKGLKELEIMSINKK